MTATVDGALVDDFISSHKSKLAKEKDRMSSTHERYAIYCNFSLVLVQN